MKEFGLSSWYMMNKAKEKPNFLFIFPDQWRWDWLGCSGHDIPVNTPHIDALAARGVRFTQCRTNSPLCSPARACLAQGLRYDRCSVPDNHVDTPRDSLTVFQLLRRIGYRVGTTGKNDLHKATSWLGLEGWTPLIGQYGFTEARAQLGKLGAVQIAEESPSCAYTALLHKKGMMATHVADYQRRREVDEGISTAPSDLPRELYTDDVTGQYSVELLNAFPRDAPWLLWVNFPGPHDPFDPPLELQERYDGVDFPLPVAMEESFDGKPLNHQQIRRNYSACCEGIDEWVGKLIEVVEARGELDNTVIIFSSDHGEMLGDHGRFTKQVPFEGSVHVPLIIAGPGIEAGAVNDALTELIDISAEITQRAGLDVPVDWDAQPLFGATPRGYQVSELGDWKMIFNGEHKLILKQGAPAELYDLNQDPGEEHNLIDLLPAKVDELLAF